MQDVLEVFGGQSLKLDLLRESGTKVWDAEVWTLKDEAVGDHCPNSRRYARYVSEDVGGGSSLKFVFLRCKLWSCPYCAKVNASVLFHKIRRGVAGCLANMKRDGFRDDYSVKFLTLTLPGREWRDEHSREDAEKTLKHAFKKMMYQLRRKLGSIEYFWVVEAQRDGFAHLHVILLGHAIGPASVLGDIEKLWREQQELGFVRLNVLRPSEDGSGLAGMCRYVSKYVTKGLKAGYPGAKTYGASSGFHKAASSGKPAITLVEIGSFTFEDGKYYFTPQWEISDSRSFISGRDLSQIEDDIADDTHKQIPIPFF